MATLTDTAPEPQGKKYTYFIEIPIGSEIDTSNMKDEEILDLVNKVLQAEADKNLKIIPDELVRVKQTQEEKLLKRQAYRKKHSMDEKTIAKREAKKLDPEYQKKQQEYASDPLVKARKVELAKGRQEMWKALKRDEARIYKKLYAQYMPKPVQRKKRSRSEEDDPSHPRKKKQKKAKATQA